MSDERDVVIDRWPGGTAAAESGPAGLLAAYHLRTQAEKGEAVPDVDGLPDRYRAEVEDPGTAFAGDVVLVASSGDAAVGCLVVTAAAEGRCEVKRLWTDPAYRGRGVASALVGAALAHAGTAGVRTVRLSVWSWRTGAIALYERLGFRVVASWDVREQLVCMERAV
ncbi:GNAT family N-acetyltransferase [Streptomyces sp. V4-01]|uniref:GNAT family N-acetyltransferase n=1 Tax=Actinacidiphila polyblastidii TaxID=3110430 RepID=A0ABU7PIR1_9ACTN|nr:GNAT family N-acetyltransferase [Streptomyces sp. V4-01]